MTGKTYFNPGCALSIYKPEMEQKILKFLNENYDETAIHKKCCRFEPGVEENSVIINVCAGCDSRFSTLYEGVSTISLWEVLDSIEGFDFPDYQGFQMTVHDPCPIREKPQVHAAVRSLLAKMNIEIVETKFHSGKSICCGDDFYPKHPLEKVHKAMKRRAESMPCEDVCVYCVSCIKSMYFGGKTPRYLVDLLMGEGTDPQIYDTVKWHEQLEEYISCHAS